LRVLVVVIVVVVGPTARQGTYSVYKALRHPRKDVVASRRSQARQVAQDNYSEKAGVYTAR